jgi:hypothetical protein
VTQQISNFTQVGSAAPSRCTTKETYSWVSGVPVSSANTNGCIYSVGVNNGFQVTVPADTTPRTLKMFIGVWGARGKLEALLSDGSAPTLVDTSLVNSSKTTNGVFTLNYQAASPGQTLTVRWTVNANFKPWANVTLQGAALTVGRP